MGGAQQNAGRRLGPLGMGTQFPGKSESPHIVKPSRQPAEAQKTPSLRPNTHLGITSSRRGTTRVAAGPAAVETRWGRGPHRPSARARGMTSNGPGRTPSRPDLPSKAFSLAAAPLKPAGAARCLGEEAGVGRAGKNGRGPLYPPAPSSDCAGLRALTASARLRTSPRTHSQASPG